MYLGLLGERLFFVTLLILHFILSPQNYHISLDHLRENKCRKISVRKINYLNIVMDATFLETASVTCNLTFTQFQDY